MNKKAQGEIITTVLIILLVLAAVVIVWQAVRGTINQGTSSATGAANCISVNLQIAKVNTTDVLVTRLQGGDDLNVTDVKVLVKGIVVAHSPAISLGTLETKRTSITAASNDTVEVAALLGSTACPVADHAVVP